MYNHPAAGARAAIRVVGAAAASARLQSRGCGRLVPRKARPALLAQQQLMATARAHRDKHSQNENRKNGCWMPGAAHGPGRLRRRNSSLQLEQPLGGVNA